MLHYFTHRGVHCVLQAAAPARPEAAAPPNKILFVQGLPETSNAGMLTMLFQQFPGKCIFAFSTAFSVACVSVSIG